MNAKPLDDEMRSSPALSNLYSSSLSILAFSSHHSSHSHEHPAH